MSWGIEGPCLTRGMISPSPAGMGGWGGREDGQKQRNTTPASTDLRGKHNGSSIPGWGLGSSLFCQFQGAPGNHCAPPGPKAPLLPLTAQGPESTDWYRQGSRKPRSCPGKEISDWLCLPEGYEQGDHTPRLLIEFPFNLRNILSLMMNSMVIPVRGQICSVEEASRTSRTSGRAGPLQCQHPFSHSTPTLSPSVPL